MDNNPLPIAATRLPRQQKGGSPILLRRAVANLVMGICEAILNHKITVQYTDGTNILNTEEVTSRIGDGQMNTVLPIQQLPGTGGSGGGIWLRYKDDFGDCLKCVYWNGTTEGATVYVAKPRKIRTTIVSETKQGVTLNYSYSLGSADTNGNHYLVRSVTSGATETDFVTPPYIFNDEIYALVINAMTLNGQTCSLLDQNVDGRAWGQ